MPCYRPLKAWRARTTNPSGKRGIVFNRNDGFSDLELEIPCGQCIGCRLERSRQWAIRCVHEASLYTDNCFITLTYNDENLPEDGSLNKRHFQLFMKRLRKKYPLTKIRYFHCGEYGDQFERPHYHALLFNFDFPDKELYKDDGTNKTYISEILNATWGLGFCLIGTVTFESAAYVARYITKKVTGEKAEEHYKNRIPEFITMSRKTGIGKLWLEKYHQDVYPDDFIIMNGKKIGVPKFYDQQLEDAELLKLKAKRKYKSYEHSENNTLRRLKDREICHEVRGKQLKRSFEQ